MTRAPLVTAIAAGSLLVLAWSERMLSPPPGTRLALAAGVALVLPLVLAAAGGRVAWPRAALGALAVAAVPTVGAMGALALASRDAAWTTLSAMLLGATAAGAIVVAILGLVSALRSSRRATEPRGDS